MTEQLPLWSVLVLPVAIGVFAFVAASAHAATASVTAGRRLTAAGLVTPARESVRLMFTQRRVTTAPDAVLWRLGGAGVIVVALLAALVVPLGDRPVLDLPVGVVWFNAMEVLLWVLVWMAGWGANSAYPLIGGYRFLAQGLAYELPLMLALITAGLGAGSLRVVDVVAAQQGRWFVLEMPVAFVLYWAGVVGFAFWGPLSAAVADDLGGGVRAELSGVDRLVFASGRYLALVVGAAFAVPLFLGGSAGPVLPGVFWVALKTLAVLLLLVWTRQLPLVRPDRYVEIAWVVLIPLILAQALVTSLLVLAGR